jgi:hypothetical protein
MKKMISISLIAVLAATLMASLAIHGVQANSYFAVVGSPGPDQFCYCIHDGNYNYPDDTWVTLGMQANYDFNNPYSYNYVYWSWETGVGGQNDHYYWWYPNYAPQFTFAFDRYGYWEGDTGSAPYSPVQNGDRWYWSWSGGMSMNPGPYIMSGETYAIFYDPNNPTIMWDIGAIPSPVDQLTANIGPPQYYYSP